MLPLTAIAATAASGAAEHPAAPSRAAAAPQQVEQASAVVHLQQPAVALAGIGVIGRSVPASLCRMSDIAMAFSSGTLSDADRARLQSEYAQLDHDVSQALAASVQQQASAQAAAVTPAREGAAPQDGSSQDGADSKDRGHGTSRDPSGQGRRPSAAGAGGTSAATSAAAHATAESAALGTVSPAPGGGSVRPGFTAQFLRQATPAQAALSVRA